MKLRRSLVIFLGLTSLIFAAPLRADEKSYSYARIVRLSMVRGDVQITRSGSSDWEAGIPNMPIQQGFAIGTNNGRAEIEFESGAAMWVVACTPLRFHSLLHSASIAQAVTHGLISRIVAPVPPNSRPV